MEISSEKIEGLILFPSDSFILLTRTKADAQGTCKMLQTRSAAITMLQIEDCISISRAALLWTSRYSLSAVDPSEVMQLNARFRVSTFTVLQKLLVDGNPFLGHSDAPMKVEQQIQLILSLCWKDTQHTT